MPERRIDEAPHRQSRHSRSDHAEPASGGGQGKVRNPAMDGRLKENRARGVSMRTTRTEDRQPGGQGRVKDPSKDRRLKKNR